MKNYNTRHVVVLISSLLISALGASQSPVSIETVQCNNWVEYVYSRGFDIMLRDSRVSLFSDDLPMNNEFRPIRDIRISRKLEPELQMRLKLDSLNTPDLIPVYAQTFFDSIDIETIGCITWVDNIRALRRDLDQNYILCAFSELYRKGRYYYFRIEMGYFIKNEFHEHSNSAIFKIELCEGNVAIFKEAILPMGLYQDGKSYFIVVKFDDKPCKR
jgi:hypothetical protein